MKYYLSNRKGDKFEFEHSKSLTRKQKKFYIRIFDELLKLTSDECSSSGKNAKQRIKVLEDNLYNVIQKYPELLYMKKYLLIETSMHGTAVWYYDYGHTFLWQLQKYKLNRLIDKLCENVETYKLNTFGDNKLFFDLIPHKPNPEYKFMIEEYEEKTKKIINALDKYPELLTLKNQFGNVFAGEIISEFKEDEYINPFMPYILASLNITEIATKQNAQGNNLGMLCAKYKNQKLFEIAYQRPEARIQKNNDGDTMEMIANNNGLIIPPLSDEQVYNYYNEIVSKKIEDICR